MTEPVSIFHDFRKDQFEMVVFHRRFSFSEEELFFAVVVDEVDDDVVADRLARFDVHLDDDFVG